MNMSSLKEYILPLVLVMATMWGFNRFVFKTAQPETTTHTFVAPTSGSAIKPVRTDITFIDEKRKTENLVTTIETEWADLDFSSEGASLSAAAFKKKNKDTIQKVYTVFSTEDKSEQFFLVALADKTPLYYQLVDKGEDDASYFVTYRNKNSSCMIEKTFTIYKAFNKIDLALRINPAHNHIVEPRLLFSSPTMPDLQYDMVSSIVITDDTFSKTSRAALKEGQGWVKPSVFGVDNKYYLHTLIKDSQAFTQRAYYKFENKQSLIAIVEGPETTQDMTWNLSFYMGPKDTEIMNLVDPRLSQTAHNYGWLSPLAKLLLYFLKWLNQYINNYGFSIIALTLLMKILLFPFTYRGEKGLNKSKENQKKLTYIEQKYKNDPEKLAQERALFLKTHGLPGLGSCLPMLLQMPIFFSLNRVLSNAPELYKAPFLWMNDLSAADPYYIFPSIIFLGMLFNAFTVDKQQRITFLVVAFVIGALSVNFSAGLSLFMCVGTVLGVLQTKLIKLLQ